MRTMFFKKKKRISGKSKGFTLVELLVVFFIMASILAVVIPGYLDYSTKLDFDNLGLDVALTIREAQGYGAGSKISSAGIFDTPYGVHFDLNNPNQFIFFEDTNKSNIYDSGDIVLSPYSIKNGYSINDLCGTSVEDTTEECKAGVDIAYLDVIFKRPNPDALITTRKNNGTIKKGTANNEFRDGARIELISPDQTIKNVSITSLGSISVPN